MKGVYKISHKTIENLVYIGRSIDIENRWKQHIRGEQSGVRLQKAFKKYGIESFEFSIVEEIEDGLRLVEREIFYIEKYNSYESGLNASKGDKTWGSYARSFVKSPDDFKTYNKSPKHKTSSKKGGSIGGLRANSNVYQLTDTNKNIYIFVGTTIFAEFIGCNKNTMKSWATTGKKYNFFKGMAIKKLGKAKDLLQYKPNIIYSQGKSGELLESYVR